MSSPFVWFHHNGEKAGEQKRFFEGFLDWKVSDGPAGMTMLTAGAGPFAALGSKGERYGTENAWIPFVQVDDVDRATKKAISLGASLVREKSPGPAGEFSIIRDPAGAPMGLWKKA
jgi:predicted enzyme related to lactoylglutathione lyase